jgi:hypothetical protein
MPSVLGQVGTVLAPLILPDNASYLGKTPGSGLAAEGSRYISYRHDNGAWLNAAEDHALALAVPGPSAGLDVEMTPCMALEDAWS